ncbi:MAG: hypothetical protein ACOX87_15205 [Chloroflexota bacterium]|jgi:hypothetical protein
MASVGNLNDNLIAFTSDHNKVGDIHISEMLKELIAGFEDIKRKNRELEKRNAELVLALQQANNKIAQSEQYPGANPELGKVALKAAAEVLKSAEVAIGAVRLAAKAQATDRYRDATNRVLELQKEMTSLLEATREEAIRYDLEANERALDILIGSRKSLLSMAEHLDVAAYKSGDTHFAPNYTSPESLVSGSDGAIGSDQRTGIRRQILSPRNQDSAPSTQDSAVSSQNAEPSTQRSGLRAQDSTQIPVQSVDVIASPFQSFGDLLSFQQAVKKLPGVIEVEAQSFLKGTLRLRIKRRGTTPLSTQLATLQDFPFELLLESENRIEINLV